MSTNSKVSELQSEATELKREVGLFGGINVLTGIMVGSGIFYIGSFVLIRTGMSLGLALLVWILGGIVTLLSGLCFAELGAMMPKAGGSYVYLREGYGEGMAFMGGLSTFILGSCGSTAALAIAFPTVMKSFFDFSDFHIKAIAIIAIIVLTGVNILGVKQGAIVQNIFTVGKLIPIIVILFAGLFMGTQTPELTFTPQTGDFSIGAVIGMIGYAIIATLWAYEGWTNLNVISEEIKEPKKNIPRAIIFSIVFVTILYTLFNFAIYRVLPYDTIVALVNNGEYYLGTETANVLFGSAGGVAVGLCMIVAVFGALNGCVMVFPRSCYAIAKDGMFPKSFAHVHEKYKTPDVALIVHMVISILLVCSNNLSQMTALVAFAAIVFNALTFYSVVIFRKKYPDMERPYTVKTPLIYITIAVMFGLIVNTLREDARTSIIGCGVVLCSLIIYFIIKKFKKTETTGTEE